ncbi:uncharacterized protein F4807DRAFT_177265 [Annulohypoxylon truncatum]|uniref:uncharacterized protein n=1 Tax=Annulohypoxylon truncatum TaxID=327061 RepID=UPI0020078D0D|nr:uncharacterized protein F4807DRAFT_177265 [Annulohypoxylon truncatum]KAI1207417.1 hypothetical protein F4807DRAFT_177265 [Annulohypoxylon truncatum]
MVYCGKPSKGCQMCRTRRIKCDETKPTCNQCAKSRRQCPGYKDEFDLVFRNETQATERRARRAGKKSLSQKTVKPDPDSPSRDLTVSPLFADSIKSQLAQAIIPSLNVPVEHQASCHFVSNFILVPPEGEGHTRGFMDFIIPLLKSDPHGHLQHAFSACSMAFLNNRGGVADRFSDRALHEYTKALNGTNAALRNPDTQLADSTLAAVLLLGLFESITAKQIGMLNWGSHTEGAIQLVKARGKKQLKTKVGLTLFIAVRTQMIIHSLTSGTTPIMGAEWWIDDAVRDGTAAKCHRLMIKTGELRAEVTRLMNSMSRTPRNIEVMLEMIRRLQAMDQEVVSWMRGVPPSWRYRTVAWEDSVPSGGDYARAEVFPGRIDMYRDFYIASVWNTGRTARLVLMSLVVRCAAWACSPVDYRTTREYATAARTCVDTITDVIASVPYHLGWHLKEGNRRRIRQFLRHQRQQQQQQQQQYDDGSSFHLGLGLADSAEDDDDVLGFNSNDSGSFACGEANHVKALAGYFLTWPLTCLNSQDYTTDAQRSWVQGRLGVIGDELGVKYAHILKQLQIRIPSMLIRRDGLMASPYGAAHDYLRLVSEARRARKMQELQEQQQQRLCMGMNMSMDMNMNMNMNIGLGLGAQQGAQWQEYGVDGADCGVGAQLLSPASSSSGSTSPLEHAEALQKERFEIHRAELLARAAGGRDAGEGAKWVAQKWLTV